MDSPMILVVEDEFLIAAEIEEVLVAAGFEVVHAANGEDALAALESEEHRLKGLVTDIRLGDHIDGWEIARRARHLISGLPVIYISADSGPDWSEKGVPGSLVVLKPFTTAQSVTGLAQLRNEANKNAPL